MDRTTFNALKAHSLTTEGVAIAETITQRNGLSKLVRRDINDETIRRIAKEFDKHNLYKDEGVLFEKIKDLPNAVTAYEKGGLYSNAYASYLESGQAGAAADYVKKLEAENPRAALNIYKVIRDTDNIRRISKAIEFKYPLSAAMGYLSIGEKDNALRCADTLETTAQQNLAKKEDIMIDVAYIRLHAGDHNGAATAYEEGGVHQMAEFLKGNRMKEYFSGLKIRSGIADY